MVDDLLDAVHLADRGWVFSDPLTTHHWVPATHVRLADGALEISRGLDGLLIERVDRIAAVDIYPFAGERVRARRNARSSAGPTASASGYEVRLAGTFT